jgi:hypothetical protein
MSLFTSKASIETRLSESETALAAANQKVTAGETHILELEENLAAVTAERDAAKLEAQTANEAKDASAAALEKSEADAKVNGATVELIAGWAGFEPGTEITAESLKTVITAKAHAQALEIASSQGCPPAPTDPAVTGNAGDEIKLAYEAAGAIEDPKARAKAFAAVTAKLNRVK